MRYQAMLVVLASAAAVACGDGTVDPVNGGSGEDIASRFEELADSVAGGGPSPTAEALRHAAEIVRLAGGATAVTLSIDGQDRAFQAVGEQLDFPQIQCTWPDSGGGGVAPSDSGGNGSTPTAPPGGEGGDCQEVGTNSMRTLIAWEPENMAEVVRIVTDLGRTEVDPDVPDVMVSLPNDEAPGADAPTPTPGDTASGPGGYPGFMGEYLVRDVGSWWAVEGSQSNALEQVTGACTDDRVTFDWAEFSCEAARLQFEFSMRVEARNQDPATHEVALAPATVAGVRLEVVSWRPLPPIPPQPEPPPGPPPVDSTDVAPE